MKETPYRTSEQQPTIVELEQEIDALRFEVELHKVTANWWSNFGAFLIMLMCSIMVWVVWHLHH